MTAVKSSEKPKKPYPEFPLTPHDRGYWVKKYKGKLYPCGPWADPKGALAYWERKRNELELGIVSTARKGDHTTVEDVINAFLDAKDAERIAGHITLRTFNGYRNQCAWLVDALGRHIPAEELRPAHFTMLRKKFPASWVYASQRTAIVHTKMVFKWAVEEELISRPINFGSVFKLPKGPAKKRLQGGKREKLFSVSEIHDLIDTTKNPQLKAMILLGLNCGFINIDCATLETTDLEDQWLQIPRTKNGNPRLAWLWPETIEAIANAREKLAKSAIKPKAGLEDRVFLTHPGSVWTDPDTSYDALSMEFAKIKREAGCHRPYVGFASLRHTFRTVADETLDIPAARYVMGHGTGDLMDDNYREAVSAERVKNVCQYVRNWFLRSDAAKPRAAR